MCFETDDGGVRATGKMFVSFFLDCHDVDSLASGYNSILFGLCHEAHDPTAMEAPRARQAMAFRGMAHILRAEEREKSLF
ncbi:unnamed protein product [Prunus brigantina]